MSTEPEQTPLEAARAKRGLTLSEVAAAVDTHVGNLTRIERGLQLPRRDLARRLHAFYRGRVRLANIYDPTFIGR